MVGSLGGFHGNLHPKIIPQKTHSGLTHIFPGHPKYVKIKLGLVGVRQRISDRSGIHQMFMGHSEAWPTSYVWSATTPHTSPIHPLFPETWIYTTTKALSAPLQCTQSPLVHSPGTCYPTGLLYPLPLSGSYLWKKFRVHLLAQVSYM